MRTLLSLLFALCLLPACVETEPPADDDDATFTTDDDDSTAADDDDSGDDDDATGDDDDATGDDDDATGDDDDATGDDDDSTAPPLPFTSNTAGGQTLTSPNYTLELYVAPVEPVGKRTSTNYELHLGPGAIRAAQ